MVKQSGKLRILHLLHLLMEQTDEEHPLSTGEIVEQLTQMGVECSRKTVAAEIALLSECGADIITQRQKGGQNRYFIAHRCFELPEVRLLIDAVGSSRFITAKKSGALIEKLKGFVSLHQAATLEQHLFIAERIKPVNESVYYTMDAISEAIYKKKKISFQYIEYTPDKIATYKHGGKKYMFSPYDMIWIDDRYYVVGWSDGHTSMVTFRVDRIKNVEQEAASAHPRPGGYSPAAYTKEVFEMFPGEMARVELLCANELMKVIIDRFGEDVQTERLDDSHFKATVDVSVSPTFFGWLVQFSGRMRILSPPGVREQMLRICQDAIS